jgi:hypothetical protein
MKKYIFIVLDLDYDWDIPIDVASKLSLALLKVKEILKNKGLMAGDINIFLGTDSDEHPNRGELNVMIAEEKSKRKGLATEAI